MIVLSDMVKDIVFGEGYSDKEKVNLLKKLMEPGLKVDVYTERLAMLCDADKERAKERAERRREQNREAQQRYREKAAMEQSAPVSKVSVRKHVSACVSKSKQCKHLTDTDTEPLTSEQTNTNRTDSDAGACACAGGGDGPPAAAAMNVRGGVSPWTMDDGELMSGKTPTVTLLRMALGRGCWRRAVEQLGEDVVLCEFAAFRAEVRAGETVDNNAAAFTSRLKKLGYSGMDENDSK